MHWFLKMCVVSISDMWFALSIIRTQRISINSLLYLFSPRSVNFFLSFSNSSVPCSCLKGTIISRLFLSLTLLQFHCLLPLGLFSSNLSITELLVLLLSTCPAITARPSWFLNPGSSYTTLSRTAYQKSARINGLHQAICYGCPPSRSWHFKKYASSPSCFPAEKGNFMPSLTGQPKKMDVCNNSAELSSVGPYLLFPHNWIKGGAS